MRPYTYHNLQHPIWTLPVIRKKINKNIASLSLYLPQFLLVWILAIVPFFVTSIGASGYSSSITPCDNMHCQPTCQMSSTPYEWLPPVVTSGWSHIFFGEWSYPNQDNHPKKRNKIKWRRAHWKAAPKARVEY